MIRNAFAFAVALACVLLLHWETRAREKQRRSDPSYCPSDVGLFVHCKDADRIRLKEWNV